MPINLGGGKPPFPTLRLSPWTCRQNLKGISGGGNCLFNDFFSVRDAHKTRFELRRRKVTAFSQHGMEKLAIAFAVTFVRCGPVNDWSVAEERGPHRTDAVCGGFDFRIRSGAC